MYYNPATFGSSTGLQRANTIVFDRNVGSCSSLFSSWSSTDTLHAVCKIQNIGWPVSSHYHILWLFCIHFKWIFTAYRPSQQQRYKTKCMLFLTAILIYTVTTMTNVFFSRLQWNNSLFLPSPLLDLGPLNPARGSGGALKAPPAGSRVEPQPKSNLVHFSPIIWHLVAIVSTIFLRTNWLNFMHARTHFPWLFLFSLTTLNFPDFSRWVATLNILQYFYTLNTWLRPWTHVKRPIGRRWSPFH